jgi:peptide methionine sulfoxide reductase MsrB
MERAFTGEYWWTNDVGRYDCLGCTQRLFMYDHKFINRSGYPTFWNCV